MKTRIIDSFILWLFLIITVSPCVAFDFIPGQYEITSSIAMPGMPAGSIPEQTTVQCMTEQDPIPKTGDAAQDCKTKNIKQSGNIMTWEMECVQQGQKMVSHGQMTFSNDKFKGTSTIKMGPEAGNMTIVSRISGTRLGECPPK
jgi:hypothetical protein